MQFIIDRFEEGYAVCEGSKKKMKNIPVADLPEGCKEGDILVKSPEGYQINASATKQRVKEIKALAEDLWE